jgi:Mg/Co/Ni transporter MgtE
MVVFLLGHYNAIFWEMVLWYRICLMRVADLPITLKRIEALFFIVYTGVNAIPILPVLDTF